MKPNGENIDIDLISRYLSGEASPREKQEVESWKESSEENLRLFEEYRAVWEKMDRVSSIVGIDIDAEWKHQESLIEGAEHLANVEQPLSAPIGRSSDSGRKIVFLTTRIAVAAVVVVALVIGGLYTSRNVGYYTMATSENSREITLPDGSSVTLNNNSQLRYPKKFNKDQRKVSLVGEGFFEVNGNKEWPFVITTREIDIKVLGTSFNVNAYESNTKIEVIVQTGQVAVTRHGEIPKTVILKPGSKAVYNRSMEDLSLSTEVDQNYLAWKTRSFVFEDQTLEDVAACLNKVYKSKISIPSDSLKSARITTTFENQSLEAILNVLSATLDMEVVEYNGQILLKESN